MKNLIALIAVFFVLGAGTVQAQDVVTPKTGAKIHLASNSFQLDANGEQTFDVWIVRSKKATKTKFEVPQFSGSANLQFTVEQNPEDSNNFKVTVKSDDVKSGEYFYTVTSRGTGIQRITGTTASFKVVDSKSVASAGNN